MPNRMRALSLSLYPSLKFSWIHIPLKVYFLTETIGCITTSTGRITDPVYLPGFETLVLPFVLELRMNLCSSCVRDCDTYPTL